MLGGEAAASDGTSTWGTPGYRLVGCPLCPGQPACRRVLMRRTISWLATALLALAMLGAAPAALADPASDSDKLREAVTLKNIRKHQAALQTIADTNGGTRAAGTAGYDQSVDYATTTMTYSGSGDVTTGVTAVDVIIPPTPTPSSTSGCETSDFAGFPAGNVARIQRGTCTVRQKGDNAAAT